MHLDFLGIGKSRTEVMAELLSEGVGTQVHYIPVYMLPYYSTSHTEKLPVAESYYESCLSIPLFSGMSDEEVDVVIEAVLNLDK